MTRIYIYIILLTGLLPVVAHSQGINMDAEVYSDKDSIGEFVSSEQQTGIYTQNAADGEEPDGGALSIIREEYYMDVLSSEVMSNNNIIKLEENFDKISGSGSFSAEKTSQDYIDEYEETLEKKGEMVVRHRAEMDKKGDSLQLRAAQFRELYDLNNEARRLDELSEKAYKKERIAESIKEEKQWKIDNAENIYRYGISFTKVQRKQRTYDRVKREVAALKQTQAAERKKKHTSFDLKTKHILQRSRIDDEFSLARKELDDAQRDVLRRKNRFKEY